MNTKVTLKYLFTILISTSLLISCSDDNDPSTPPSVDAPGNTSVLIGGSVELTFSVSTENGYDSSTISVSNGNATISSEPQSGAPSGNVVVSYTVNTQGAGSVELTVADEEGLTDNATAVITVGEEETEVRVTDNITGTTTWEDGKTYILAGRIAVESGATLNIEAGAVVKGEAGQEANSSVLLVARGGTLNANGTPDQPIIFTSIADEITPEDIDNGNFGSPNLSPAQRGLWGGVIILGNAPISASNESGDVTEVQIEGIPSSDSNGLYGGDEPSDNSGTITNISIRHGGTLIGEGNEINGLTLGGVGDATTIQNVEIVANEDDGVEFFGGTVSVTNVLVWNNGDDAIDTDQAWSGSISNIIIASPGDSPFELDGPEGSFTGSGHTIQDASVFVSGGGAEEMIDVDDETDVNMSNILFFGLAQNEDGEPAHTISDDYDEYEDNDNGFAITNLEAVIPDGFTVGDYFPGLESETTAVASASAATVGATDVSVFSFTWSSQASAFPTEFGL